MGCDADPDPDPSVTLRRFAAGCRDTTSSLADADGDEAADEEES